LEARQDTVLAREEGRRWSTPGFRIPNRARWITARAVVHPIDGH